MRVHSTTSTHGYGWKNDNVFTGARTKQRARMNTNTKMLKLEICEKLLALYSHGSRIDKKREYVLLLASCMIDWYSILRERTSRSWTRKVKNLFECFVSDKSGDVTRNQQLTWKLDICKMKSAIEQNDINLLYSCSIVKKIYLEKQLVYALYNKNRKK